MFLLCTIVYPLFFLFVCHYISFLPKTVLLWPPTLLCVRRQSWHCLPFCNWELSSQWVRSMDTRHGHHWTPTLVLLAEFRHLSIDGFRGKCLFDVQHMIWSVPSNLNNLFLRTNCLLRAIYILSATIYFIEMSLIKPRTTAICFFQKISTTRKIKTNGQLAQMLQSSYCPSLVIVIEI